MQLLLLKQGGQEIYVGPLGHNSSNLINYFEVGRKYVCMQYLCMCVCVCNQKCGILISFLCFKLLSTC